MIDGVSFLASYGLNGGAFGDLLNRLDQMGFFSYALPFLVIFALVYGILTQTKIFGTEQKGLYAIIGLAVSLMSLQFDFVPQFFSSIFPKLGVGLAILLVALILVGLFSDRNMGRVMFILGALIGVIIIIQSLGDFGTNSGTWLARNYEDLIPIVLVIVGTIAIIASFGAKKQGKNDVSPFAQSLFGIKPDN